MEFTLEFTLEEYKQRLLSQTEFKLSDYVTPEQHKEILVFQKTRFILDRTLSEARFYSEVSQSHEEWMKQCKYIEDDIQSLKLKFTEYIKTTFSNLSIIVQKEIYDQLDSY
jgi:hypothetical protein